MTRPVGRHDEPKPGQVWSILATGIGPGRTEFTIAEVKPDASGQPHAYGRTRHGREIRMSVTTLRAGRRGARLLREADGSPVE